MVVSRIFRRKGDSLQYDIPQYFAIGTAQRGGHQQSGGNGK